MRRTSMRLVLARCGCRFDEAQLSGLRADEEAMNVRPYKWLAHIEEVEEHTLNSTVDMRYFHRFERCRFEKG